ncbi:MAG: CusA/CzcA family heavy metal efflux RND transporter, partial [Candidatus Aminicenantes bacterium]|nr:CusA/CzcA family heavy metal efflux RND transporter [Candidatus Aminicenantes bacterium]
MIDRIVELSIRHRFLLVFFTFFIIGGGIFAYQHLTIDALPDITPVMVEIFTEAHGLAAEEVERHITYPIEVSMNGLPGVTVIRSQSKFSISWVTVYFKEGTDLYQARQLVFERLQKAQEEIPPGYGRPQLGPLTTGLGQIFSYIIEGEGYDLMQLRVIQDWIVKYILRTVPGVTDVLGFGGQVKQYQIEVDPDLLLKYQLTLDQLITAVAENNLNVGGSYIERGDEEYIVRGIGRIQRLDDIANIIVTSRGGVPLYVKDVAQVRIGPAIRRGLVSRNGQGEIVTGIVLKLVYQNTSEVINRVKDKIKEINDILPPGVTIRPYYDQSVLVARCVGTVKNALLLGILLVIAVLVPLLGDLRSALIVILCIPICSLLTFILMNTTNLSANLMSLGGLAIGIGLLVDPSTVMMENIYRHLSSNLPLRNKGAGIIKGAAKEVGRPITFAVFILIVVFLPLFTLQGMEKKLFTPMAMTISFAILGSLLFALFLVPALASFLFRSTPKRGESPLFTWLKRLYSPLLQKAIHHRKTTIAIAIAVLAISLAIIPFLGTEFTPTLDEEYLLIRVTMAPSTSLREAADICQRIEKVMLTFPETENIISRIGMSEVGACPEMVNNAELFTEIKPRREWSTAKTKDELIEKMGEKLHQLPGILISFSQPLEERQEELLQGIKAQVAIKLFGDDLSLLVEKGAEIERVVSTVRGVEDLAVEQLTGQPHLEVEVNRQAIARYGINTSQVMDVVRAAVGGTVIGQVFEGHQRFDIFLRFLPEFRRDPLSISNILISSPDGQRIPLSRLAAIRQVIAPREINRENNLRRIIVQCNVRGRDIGSWVKEAQRKVSDQVKLPPGYFITWGGEFENQQRAMRRLALIIPISVILIFILLATTFRSLRYALLIILAIPFAFIGGILALFLSGQYLSVPASIGFIVLFG